MGLSELGESLTLGSVGLPTPPFPPLTGSSGQQGDHVCYPGTLNREGGRLELEDQRASGKKMSGSSQDPSHITLEPEDEVRRWIEELFWEAEAERVGEPSVGVSLSTRCWTLARIVSIHWWRALISPTQIFQQGQWSKTQVQINTKTG